MELIGKQIAIETILGQPPELHYPSWYAAQIEKLPPAPPEYLAEQVGILVTDSDTISRQAAIEALRAMQTYKLFAGDDMLLIDQAGAQTELMMLPPARPEQPEPKRGEWLERDVIDEPKGKHITQWQSARCSVCGRYHTTPYLYSFTHYNFCPNCGADMREVTE